MKEIRPIIEDIESGLVDNTRSSQRLLRETLSNCGLDNFESALFAVEKFLGNFELFDPEIGFGEASEALAMAALAFASIDVDHDERLSRNELLERAAHLDASGSQLMEWVLIHFDAIQRAGFAHHIHGISKADLLRASSFFTGLETARLNFDSICSTQKGERKALNHDQLASFLRGDGKALPPASRAGLIQLMHYLRNLELHGHLLGLDRHDLSELTPEVVWKLDSV